MLFPRNVSIFILRVVVRLIHPDSTCPHFVPQLWNTTGTLRFRPDARRLKMEKLQSGSEVEAKAMLCPSCGEQTTWVFTASLDCHSDFWPAKSDVFEGIDHPVELAERLAGQERRRGERVPELYL